MKFRIGDRVRPTQKALIQGVAKRGDEGVVTDQDGFRVWVARLGYRTIQTWHHNFWTKVT